MSNALFDSITRVARHESAQRATASIGQVTAVNTTAGFGPDHSVGVELRDLGLILPSVPIAVGALGFVATPAVGDLVLVVFADGDLHAPIVVGRLYNSDLAAPDHTANQLVLALPPGAASPKVIVTIDSAKPQVEVTVGATTATISDAAVELKTGNAALLLDAGGSEDVTLTAGNASINLAGNGDVTIEAAGTLTLKASNIEIAAQAKLDLQGSLVEVN